MAAVEGVQGSEGRFEVTVRQKPRYIDLGKCTACGDCAAVCPVERPNEYDLGLNTRRATYKVYAQAIPGGYCIEKLDRAPCGLACPAGLNVQGYVAMVKQGNYTEAIKIILEKLPLPGVLGRICPHQCEKSCRRREKDEALSIRELKRIAADQVDLSQIALPKITPQDKHVAIIGSGPSGLTAAYFLALKGYATRIYEALPEAGGMLRYGIPAYRLPRRVLDQEIDFIKRFGVEIQTNTPLGKNLTIDDLLSHGYGAVYLATGAHRGLRMRIPGEDQQAGVIDAVTFLRQYNLGEMTRLKGKVVVIGGAIRPSTPPGWPCASAPRKSTSSTAVLGWNFWPKKMKCGRPWRRASALIFRWRPSG